MLDARAPESEIAAVSFHFAGRTRTLLHAAEHRQTFPGRDLAPLAKALDNLARECQARPIAPGVRLSGRIGRLLEPRWWTRNLRRELLRENEVSQHAQGHIRRNNDCYVTDHAVRAKRTRARINRLILEGSEVVNEDGLALNLAEVADKSISNPKLRRSELMVRCRGFEETAAYMRHSGVFLTITCPSRFHRFDANGRFNKRWTADCTPKAAQKYLCTIWSRMRAKWKRLGIHPYGFRIAEPHHDGCPHWHVELFLPPEQIGSFSAELFAAGSKNYGDGLLGAAGRYAMEDTPNERGAVQHRFKVVPIDPAKGSATGYIAKYICKNIDGYQENGDDIGLDFASGTSATEAAVRVRAWASTWSIRQFQQIGGPSVTVWRELRRLANDADQPVLAVPLFEAPRAAADRALWSLFWVLQGGPEVPRKELTLRPMYVTEECSGRYGDDTKRVRGVQGRDDDLGGLTLPLITRMHNWTVQASGRANVDDAMYAWRYTLAVRAKHPDMWAAMQRIETERLHSELRCGEAAAPWTRVNNCTKLAEVGHAMHALGMCGAIESVTHLVVEPKGVSEPDIH
jgi:hypothetical protein